VGDGVKRAFGEGDRIYGATEAAETVAVLIGVVQEEREEKEGGTTKMPVISQTD
jgi:hypothetical protein